MIDIWLFVPLGTGLCKVYQKKWVLLIPFIMSVAIEMTQYITGLGIAELDDVFGNTLSSRDKQSLATLIYYPKEKKLGEDRTPKVRRYIRRIYPPSLF